MAKKEKITDEICVTMLTSEANEIQSLLRKSHIKMIELGEQLEIAWEKLKPYASAKVHLNRWAKEHLGLCPTSASNWRRLYRMMNGIFKPQLEVVAPDYFARTKVSQLSYALNKLEARTKVSDGQWNKDAGNLVEIDFQQDAMMLKFSHTEEQYDLRTLTFKQLKALCDPNKPSATRRSVTDLENQVKTLTNALEQERLRVKELEATLVSSKSIVELEEHQAA